MSNTCFSNGKLTVPSSDNQAAPLSFEMQPIVAANGLDIAGYELLFRGPSGMAWIDVDCSVLRHLGESQAALPPLFVNLANETLLSLPVALFVAAAQRRDVTFEVSEMQSDQSDFSAIVEKVNQLISAGLKFAIDDFGSGLDGLRRLYSLNKVAVVKIDGHFLKHSMRRADAANALCALAKHWKSNGIQVVAEGVETGDIYGFARQIGVDLFQGWHMDALVGEWLAKNGHAEFKVMEDVL